MSIQSSINQLLGTVGVGVNLYAHSNAGKAYLAKRSAQINERAANSYQPLTQSPQTAKTATSAYNEHLQAAQKGYQTAAQLKPTTGNIQKYMQLKAMSALTPDLPNGRFKVKDTVKQTQKKTRRNFKDYLSGMETNFGGTVGELPAHVQKQIASNYTSSQRRSIMNAADRQKQLKKEIKK